MAVLYCGVKGLLLKLPVDKVEDFQEEYLRNMHREHPDILARIAQGEMDAGMEDAMKRLAAEVVDTLVANVGGA